MGAALLALVAAGCAQNYYLSAGSWSPAAEATVSVGDLDAVVVDGRQGWVTFTASSGGPISVAVSMAPARGAVGSVRSCPESKQPLEVVTTRRGRALALAVRPRPGEECVVRWDVRIPATLTARARFHAGHLAARGVAGGVVLRSQVGDITVDAPGGPVRAVTGVGEVQVRYGGDDYGEVRIRSRVGNVNLTMAGTAIKEDGSPGSGGQLTLDGGGRWELSLESNAGDVSLVLTGGG